MLSAGLPKAALVTFGGHANVQHQGSTRKGTGLAASSDWDFYVNLDDTISTVTHMQRMAVVDQLCKQLLPSAGIDYSIRCGVNRAFMWNGSDDRGPLPDVDLVFERFKLDVRRAPKSKAFAHSQVAQQVVKYIKRLPVRFTQLHKPKSSLVESFVLQLQQQQFGDRRLKGEKGFEALLIAVLEAVAGAGGAAVPAQALNCAKLDVLEWQAAAHFVLDKRTNGCGWILV
ncbi:hypothetical protein COO60DRAFT_1633484 [Scenedesmus sp. NREL 46B-D3]|nr:hypothetical protein COO60DRAFT_1633484 [Scenedesmus sp. NREL 46B-D3]